MILVKHGQHLDTALFFPKHVPPFKLKRPSVGQSGVSSTSSLPRPFYIVPREASEFHLHPIPQGTAPGQHLPVRSTHRSLERQTRRHHFLTCHWQRWADTDTEAAVPAASRQSPEETPSASGKLLTGRSGPSPSGPPRDRMSSECLYYTDSC